MYRIVVHAILYKLPFNKGEIKEMSTTIKVLIFVGTLAVILAFIFYDR